MTMGRKVSEGTHRRTAWVERFALPKYRAERDSKLPTELLAQLDGCKDDEARRLLLGISEKEASA